MSIWTQIRQDDGDGAVEMAILLPTIVLFLLFLLGAHRVGQARSTVDGAAYEAARSATLARTSTQAVDQANASIDAAFSQRGMSCTDRTVDVDTAGFHAPVGTPAVVTVDVTCRVPLSDLGLPAQGSISVHARHASALDTFRERS